MISCLYIHHFNEWFPSNKITFLNRSYRTRWWWVDRRSGRSLRKRPWTRRRCRCRRRSCCGRTERIFACTGRSPTWPVQCQKYKVLIKTGLHSSVELSVPTILQPQVRIPSTSTSIYAVDNIYYRCKQKRPGLALLRKRSRSSFAKKVFNRYSIFNFLIYLQFILLHWGSYCGSSTY